MHRFVCLAIALAVAPRTGLAQDAHSGYAAHQHRSVKALSPEETAALVAGEGYGMALPAELNGYPGPRHVLDLRDSLALTADQQRRLQAVFDTMQAGARALGRRIVDLEGRLDAVFAGGAPDPDTVRTLTGEIGRLRGELRGVHLVAHLETAALLDGTQRDRYGALRGYDPGAH